MRLEPRSYFCNCWKVSPTDLASASWLKPRALRRSRSWAPTWTSIRFGLLRVTVLVMRGLSRRAGAAGRAGTKRRE